MDEGFAEIIREKGNEYGTTTGRPRRVGWLDLVQLNSGSALNGYKSLAITKLDVLADMEKIKVCTAYEHPTNGKIGWFPSEASQAFECRPVLREMEGFSGEEIKRAKTYSELPSGVKSFIELIEDHIKTEIKMVSTGPRREETIYK